LDVAGRGVITLNDAEGSVEDISVGEFIFDLEGEFLRVTIFQDDVSGDEFHRLFIFFFVSPFRVVLVSEGVCFFDSGVNFAFICVAFEAIASTVAVKVVDVVQEELEGLCNFFIGYRFHLLSPMIWILGGKARK